MIIGTLVFLLFFTSLPSFAATIIYEYDALNRLHAVNYGNGFLETYDYDATGNRTSLAIADVVSPTGNITTSQITLTNGNATISGTASDLGSGVQKVEISFDDGQTWHTATGTTNWSYTWATTPAGTYPISVRVTDKSGNTQVTSYTITVSATLYADFGSDGIWMYNGTTWIQLTPSSPETMVAAGSSLYGDFGNNGIWMWDDTSWSQLTPYGPTAMVATGSLLYANYGNGIWMYNGSTWSQATPNNPEAMVASGSLLYADFGSTGIWMYNGATWTQLAPENPDSMVVSY